MNKIKKFHLKILKNKKVTNVKSWLTKLLNVDDATDDDDDADTDADDRKANPI